MGELAPLRSRGVKPGCKGRAAKKVREWMKGTPEEWYLAEHKAWPVTDEDYRWADVILYMDGGNFRKIPESYQHKAECLGTYAGVRRIPDPAFLKVGSRELSDVLDLVVRAAGAAGRELVKRKTPGG